MNVSLEALASQPEQVRIALKGREIEIQSHGFPQGAKALMALPLGTPDPIVNEYLKGASPNEYMLDVMLQTTLPGDQVLDLGCHVGTFAVGAAALSRAVVAVDASPFHVGLVEQSRFANQFKDLHAHWIAIDATHDSVRLMEIGIYSHVDRAGDARAITVPATTLDAFAEQHIRGRVAFLKMDIEGAEIDVLRSGKKLLTSSRPVVLFESNGMTLNEAGSSVDELRSAFEALGFKVFRIEGDRWVHAPVGQPQPEAWVDMLALSDAHQAQWADRIVWQWSPEAVYERSVGWAALPYKNTREYLLAELRSRQYDPAIQARIGELAQSVERGLAQEK
jgi:FkbM family methyltransferase